MSPIASVNSSVSNSPISDIGRRSVDSSSSAKTDATDNSYASGLDYSRYNMSHKQHTAVASSAASDDGRSTQKGSRGSKRAGKSSENTGSALSEDMLIEHGNGTRVFQSHAKTALGNEDWEQPDTARDTVLSTTKAQLQGNVNLLAYIQELERTIGHLTNTLQQQGLHRGNPDHKNNPRKDSLQRRLANGVIDTSPDEGHGDPPNEGWKLEVKRYKKVNDRYGSADFYDESEKIEDIRKRERELHSGGYVLTMYDEYDSEGNRMHVNLDINSPPLLDLLRKTIKYYPGNEFDILMGKDAISDVVSFANPYMILFAHRKQLYQSLSEDYPEDAKQHLKILLELMKTEHPKYNARLTEIEEGRCKKISFEQSWLLYPPDTPVYQGKGKDNRQIVVYSGNAPVQNAKGQWSSYTLQCWDVDYEHKVFRRNFFSWVMEPYLGEKNILNLELIPAKFMPNESELRSELLARGQRYFDLNKTVTLQDYYGNRFPRVYKDEPVRVVVDEGTYWSKNPPPDSHLDDDQAQEYGFPEGKEELVNEDNLPLDDTLIRCFPRVAVFSLRDKEWALVKVNDLKPVTFKEKAFRRLVIKDEYKKIIKAMVQAYMLEQPGFSDFVSGKGRGLTILLHGPPGTGKTLTAECVAEHQERPLFTISCGDLGIEPEQLEAKLKEVFQYAVTWKAILLLDEADIFLQERDIHDVKRNALVSIFLRELEYFDGILFLTTNRPGDIDEAFVSRIHITVGLKQLDSAERRKIWSLFIKDLDVTDSEKRNLLSYVTEKFENDRLNGRQIRNTVRTALAMAQLKKEHVNTEHLEQVVKIGREYAAYMEELNKMNADDYAISLGRR